MLEETIFTSLVSYGILGIGILVIFTIFYKVLVDIGENIGKNKTRKTKKSGYVYIISNPSFKNNIYKIGMTKRTIRERVKELFTTGVPTPFVIEREIFYKDPVKLEDYLHLKFAKYRINKRREFFNIPISKIDKELKSLGLL